MENPADLSDEDLVEYVRTKNQELFREIIKRYQSKLMRYAQYILQSRDETMDVVQESLIKAFINLNGFDKSKKFSSWMYRIVHNEAINLLQKRKKQISLEENEWVENLEQMTDLPDEIFDRKHTVTTVRKCLDKLPLIYRIPLALMFLEEKSYEQISELLKLPMGTVSTRISRAKKMMKLAYTKLEESI